jgi:hypothetical protein
MVLRANDASDRGTPSRLSTAVVVFLTAYVSVATLPNLFVPLQPGLDESWIYAINRLPWSEFHFGHDIVFTYGPLGYLLHPAPTGPGLPIATGFALLAQLTLASLILFAFRGNRDILPVLAFVVLSLAAIGMELLYEYRLLILVGLLLSVSPRDSVPWRISAVAAGVLGAVLLYSKLNIGVAALAAIAVAATMWLVRQQTNARTVLLYLLAPYVFTVLVLSFPLLGGPVNLPVWFGGATEILTGYSLSMSLPFPTSVLALAIAATAIVVGAAAGVSRLDRESVLAAAPAIAIILMSFRHAFTRSDGRPFFAVLVAALGIVILNATGRRALGRCVVGTLVLVPVALIGSGVGLEAWVSGFDVRPGLRSLIDITRLDEVRRDLLATTRKNLAADRLPPSIVEQVRGRGGEVDILPVAITFVPSNGLNWVPNPVLQTYQAFTSKLDARVATHFAGPEAPDFLLYQFTDIDQRHPILASPSMWRSILSHYELGDPPHAFGTFGEVALLKRRAKAVALRLVATGTTRARIGEWVAVPRSADLVFASVDLRPTTLGRLAAFLWRVDEVLIDLNYLDGRELTFRLLPGVADDGLLMNHLPSSMYELLNLLQGVRPSPVLRFRIRGPGTSGFDQDLLIAWRTAAWLDAPSEPAVIEALPPVV